jgi:hypothetical protein
MAYNFFDPKRFETSGKPIRLGSKVTWEHNFDDFEEVTVIDLGTSVSDGVLVRTDDGREVWATQFALFPYEEQDEDDIWKEVSR